MAMFSLGEFNSKPSRRELHITSSEVSPDENSNSTVSMVAGHAASRDFRIRFNKVFKGARKDAHTHREYHIGWKDGLKPRCLGTKLIANARECGRCKGCNGHALNYKLLDTVDLS